MPGVKATKPKEPYQPENEELAVMSSVKQEVVSHEPEIEAVLLMGKKSYPWMLARIMGQATTPGA